ncbi:MAG: dGTPase [Thermosipho sp. (in: thermotogales)]|nr:dGTPase [Thermosipho sp. (in: thermotogales)]MDN5325107.1 dGTPase [Thermosipho sp. (in: thermotogales)]
MNGEDSVNEKLIKLDKMEEKDKGFKHNLQALRILKDLTMNYKGTYGLDISKKTLWGIVNHSSLEYKDGSKLGFYDRYLKKVSNKNWTIEALVVKDADEIAQRHHDIEDAIELELIPKKDLLEKIKEIFETELKTKKMYGKIIDRIESENLTKSELITNYSKLIVDMYVSEYIKSLENLIMELNEREEICHNEFRKNVKSNYLKEFCREQLIEKNTGFSKEFEKKDKKFQEFLKNVVLNSQSVQMMDGKGKYIIRRLFQAYFTNPQQMPDKTIKTFLRNLRLLLEIKKKQEDIIPSFIRNEIERYHKRILKEEKVDKKFDVFAKFLEKKITVYEYKVILMRTITDYIAGMTDKYALKQYEILYGTAY